MLNIRSSRRVRSLVLAAALSASVMIGYLLIASDISSSAAAGDDEFASEAQGGQYVVLAWNDLGMHCYNGDFRYFSVLPPYNTLWAQVVRVGDPPQIVTSGISVTYAVQDNTYSVGKTNFWDYASALGWDLAPGEGLAGFGMAGEMASHGDHFVAEGIPLTEYTDSAYESNPSDPAPTYYQLGTVTVRDAVTGEKLAETQPVLPVSTEMNCDDCHYDGGVDDIATGSVELNILTLHDRENADEYPVGHEGALVDRAPIQCAECHGSNALNMPGVAGLGDVAVVIHDQHAGRVADSIQGCYKCHPGPQTQCLRGVMSWRHGMDCTDCHGSMEALAEKDEPWLEEPRCGDANCHEAPYAQNQSLYRLSWGHGDVYCEGCHDSPHAIAPSRVITDGVKFVGWQGHDGPLDSCAVCHASPPAAPGPHGLEAPDLQPRLYLPLVMR